MEIRIRNVEQALIHGVGLLRDKDLKPREIIVRGLRTLEFPEPITTIYRYPRERILFNPIRDANPFFHFFESLWMLAGRNDVWFLEKFNPRMKEYLDNGEDLYGAYGYRWRNYFGHDQLNEIITTLRSAKASRRAVLEIWSNGDLRYANSGGKDSPCNTHAYFKIRNNKLNMTLCCRSNDMLWGAYGANAVHFSMLQEYLANKLGVEVGLMYQHSDSLHVYLDGPGGELWDQMRRSALNHDYSYDTKILIQ